MKMSSLSVHIFNKLAGHLTKVKGGKLSFTYTQDYLEDPEAIPLSISMPLLLAEHKDEVIRPWLWGLMPDSEWVLRQWSRRFQVAGNDIYGLIRSVGEDCAGAVRFADSEEVYPLPRGKKELKPTEIERRLGDLIKDPSLGREPTDRGQFSLAGAQAKIALQKTGKKWYLPWGDEPTTHILKPPRPDLDGYIENEHFCLKLAYELGIPVAKSEVLSFGEQQVISIERFDRFYALRRWERIHQEDACQALSLHPERKYQSEGGPGVVELMKLLNRCSKPVADRERFIEYLVFNYLILGTDAHAKNYSIQLGPQGYVVLAPLYDVASLLPYIKRKSDVRFAMKYGGYYKDAQIRRRHFEKLANECSYPAPKIIQQVRTMAGAMLECVSSVVEAIGGEGITHPVLRDLEKKLKQRCERVLRELV